jgi:type VI secretion system secreted protein VgrG
VSALTARSFIRESSQAAQGTIHDPPHFGRRKKMPTYFQADRPLSVTTPLGKDDLLLIGLSGHEAISQLFSFQLELLAENATDIAFDRLLGQKVSVTLRLSEKEIRHFSGIVSRVSQGVRDTTFTSYRMEVVPQFWLLTKRSQSRIFQQLNVPDILKKVLAGLDVSFELQGTFQPRDFCVQYRESDFHFASRLMEEEGIYYFFKHTAGGHKMVVANSPHSHPDVQPAQIIYETIEGGVRPEKRVHQWQKVQELRSGKYTLWDHSFELPHKHLEADKTIADSVAAGKVTHKLKVGNNDRLEIYDYPGAYAQRFDGIAPGGGDRAADVQKIFQDNVRTVEIRMQEEAMPSVVIEGVGGCGQFTAGHHFNLERHYNADGQYMLTGVQHSAKLTGDYRSSESEPGFEYSNTFTCIPAGTPYRPPRQTPLPRVYGTQTAVVVGPKGDEIFVDKYGRIKVQFHWDREGKNDGDSSCWVRVATPWAGKQWGVIHIPRIGHEVVVDFEEGDPDRPIVVGSVYNAEMMPPYTLPGNKTQSGVKSRSSLGGGPANFNEIRFEDKKDSEQLFIHAEKNQDIEVEHDETHWVGNDRSKKVDHDETTSVGRNRTESVGNDESISINKNRTETVGNNESITIGSSRSESVGANDTITVGAKSETSAGMSIELKVGSSSIKITPMSITIKSMMIKIEADMLLQEKSGLLTQVNSDVFLMCKGALTMIN